MRKREDQKPKTKDQRPKKVFAKKSFGQNFLVDQNYVNKIISALNLQPDETIIEIGAGRGALTEKLIESGANVIAIELEREMIAVLKDRFSQYENFQLVEQDGLKVDFNELQRAKNKGQRTKLVANLPYNISTAILQKLIEQREVFSEMILMFQREVVERITAKVGNKERGYLSVLVEAYLQTQKLFDVPPTAFRPAPKVWSSIVRLIPNERSEISQNKDKLFKQLISVGFTQKRKTILNNLKNLQLKMSNKIETAEKLLELCEIDSNRRAETLTLTEWLKILKLLSPNN